MNQNQKCFFCETDAEVQVMSAIKETYFVKCPVCGRYEVANSFLNQEIKDYAASYLYHHGKEKGDSFIYFLGEESDFTKEYHTPNEHIHFVSIEEIRAYYPKSFSEKVDRSLVAFAKKSEYFGNMIRISDDEIISLLFIRRFDTQGSPLPNDQIRMQYKRILEYFEKQGYISGHASDQSTRILLLADGWKQIEKLNASMDLSRDVFVSMSFADESNPIREAIRKGIIGAGFSAEFMDEIIHNRQIIPEMFRLIRECRFLIMDISDPNYGAYYEAGYAQGLGKEVIITCSNETFNREYKTKTEKKYARYLKPHFDILQKQILRWDDYADLTHKLTEWIKALF